MNHDEPLEKQIKKLQILEQSVLDKILRRFTYEIIPKNKFFLEAGTRYPKIGFLTSGILCSFIYNSEGEEVVKHFIEPDQFFTDLESYEHGKPAKLNIQAVVDSTVLTITKEHNQQLIQDHPQWEFVLKNFSSDALNRMIQMQNFLHFGSAVGQYQHFVSHYPNLARQVPLKYIASYLGITQSSLSRIRREY